MSEPTPEIASYIKSRPWLMPTPDGVGLMDNPDYTYEICPNCGGRKWVATLPDVTDSVVHDLRIDDYRKACPGCNGTGAVTAALSPQPRPKPAATPDAQPEHQRRYMSMEVVLCDIDGTLAHRSDRSPFDWGRVGEDTLNGVVNRLLLCMNTPIVFMSGRDEVCRPETEAWLQSHGWLYNKLYMRAKDDNRKDSIVKRELYERYIKDKYNVLFVLDDRNQVVDMWRNELGLVCLQVAEGDF